MLSFGLDINEQTETNTTSAHAQIRAHTPHTRTEAHTHTHTHTHAHTHTRTHAHTHTRTHARTHAHTHAHVHTRTHTRNKSYHALNQSLPLVTRSNNRQIMSKQKHTGAHLSNNQTDEKFSENEGILKISFTPLIYSWWQHGEWSPKLQNAAHNSKQSGTVTPQTRSTITTLKRKQKQPKQQTLNRRELEEQTADE